MQSIPSVSIQQPPHFLPASPGASQNQPSSGPQHATPVQIHRRKRAANPELALAQACTQNQRTLGQKLNEIATRLGTSATPQAILGALKTTTIDIYPESFSSDARTTVTLEAYIRSSGLRVPSSHFALTGLAESVLSRAQEHPLGNFGGALSWPLPLSADGQRSLVDATRRFVTQHPNLPRMDASQSVLEYLNSNQPLPSEAAQDPAKALEMLLATPRALALGQTLQTELNGIATDSSVNDYTLAAMNLLLDPESMPPPHAKMVAGFDLAQQSHWGKPASALFDHLSAHLSRTHRTTPEMAKAGAYLLLARKAPELLIKDLPANLTYGSPAWVSLSIAAATIEAQTPGKVPNMTFVQVMLGAENAGLQDLAVTQQAQAAALRTWGVVNGVLSEDEAARYNTSDIEKVRGAFNLQADARVEASDQIEATIPSRKDIALAKLKERFGENVPFEEKLLTVRNTTQPYAQPLYDPNRAPAGRHSLLDIAMSGLHHYQWESTDDRIVQATRGKSLKFDVKEVFDTELSQAMGARKKGVATAIKQMIAQLPVRDRENLEYGKLEFYQNHTYTLGMGFTDRTLTEKNSTLLIKSTGVNGQRVYQVDLKQGTVKPVPDTVLTRERGRNANRVYPIEAFTPTGMAKTAFEQNTPAQNPLPVPNSFSSTRTQAIADAFVQHLDIDNEDVIKQAKGATTFDRQMETQSKLADFFLDLIPLKSAIQNFVNGNYLDGAVDLGMDIFGFVTAGVGAAAKVAKVGAKAASAATKALKVARILGTTLIGELNPVSGVGSFIEGSVKVIGKGVDKVKAASGTLIQAVSREHGPITRGTFKVADQAYEADTILSNGQRYAYDPDKMKPYGTPLDEFSPLDVLMPPSPRPRDGLRYDPLSRTHRPAHRVIQPRVPLPTDEYAISRHTNGALIEDHFTPNRIQFTREKFTLEKNGYFRDVAAGNIPPRPALPDITEKMTPNELIAEALKKTDVLVFGERHSEVASLIAMRDAMKTFQEGGVNTIFLEGATLDAYGLIADTTLAHTLSKRKGGATLYDELKKAAEESGIEIMPLEHRYLTRHSDSSGYFSGLGTLDKTSPEYTALSKQRLEEVNYYGARQVMKNELGGKSVVWVGRAHMNTAEGVPGIAELTGGIGIGVYQKADIAESVARKADKQRDTSAALSKTDDTVGDMQIDIKV